MGCYVCGTPMEHQTVRYVLATTIGEVMVEHVPALVCPHCREQLFTLETVRRLQAMKDRIEAGTTVPDRAEVPCLVYA